jgi:hypothetical protein
MSGQGDPGPHAAEPLPDLGPHKVLSLAESLAPYAGPVVRGVDATTIRRKVMCGYQGWFMAKGDGYEPGFVHWGGVDRTPPRCTVDLWPEMTELDEDEKFATNYRYADGTRARVFSSTVKKTVVRHFKWMRDYGIDGAFIQRFTSCVSNQRDWNYQRSCAVLSHCREGANRYGRAFAVMYDTNFDRKAVDAMKRDWTRLVREMKVLETPAYVRHRGGPLVSLWGYGFGHRKFDAVAAEEFFRFLKAPENGGCTIMLGVPNDWATWTDDRMRLVEEYATVISPWNVGRYGDPEGARRHFEKRWPGDIALCKENDLDYYAVAFPGFSWTNLQKGQAALNQIPRRGGAVPLEPDRGGPPLRDGHGLHRDVRRGRRGHRGLQVHEPAARRSVRNLRGAPERLLPACSRGGGQILAGRGRVASGRRARPRRDDLPPRLGAGVLPRPQPVQHRGGRALEAALRWGYRRRDP